MTNLINKTNVRKLMLELSRTTRAGKFKRVSANKNRRPFMRSKT